MNRTRLAGQNPSLHNGKSHELGPAKQLYFTIDCDWVPGSQKGLEELLACCDRYDMKATVFFAGHFAKAYPELVRECHRRGHQLGTHGWAHGGLEEDEDFRTAGYEQQRQWIRQATEAVEQAAGVRPLIFRAPNLWVGETTLRVLEEEGYLYDSSVPARRFDFGFGRDQLPAVRGPDRQLYLFAAETCGNRRRNAIAACRVGFHGVVEQYRVAAF